MNLATLNHLRQQETESGALKFPTLHSDKPTLLGRPVRELSQLQGNSDITPAANDTVYPVIYGNFSNFVIVDRLGASFEVVPHLFGANQRPTGQRGGFLFGRTGSDSVNDNAFRMLKVTTTA
ncbi:phage major capsid protein [Nocardia sp. NBC_01329]|nr:phage major capsid protein [Nocardia sp. NBC_01329]